MVLNFYCLTDRWVALPRSGFASAAGGRKYRNINSFGHIGGYGSRNLSDRSRYSAFILSAKIRISYYTVLLPGQKRLPDSLKDACPALCRFPSLCAKGITVGPVIFLTFIGSPSSVRKFSDSRIFCREWGLVGKNWGGGRTLSLVVNSRLGRVRTESGREIGIKGAFMGGYRAFCR